MIDGFSPQTFDEILAEVQAEFRGQYGDGVATSDQTFMGRLQHLFAQHRQWQQELVVAVVQAIDPRSNEGVAQDRTAALIGMTRLAAAPAEVIGTATGTAATVINNGVRLSVGGRVFEVAEGPHVITGGGTVLGVRLIAQENGAVDVTVLGAWTIVDAVAGFVSFDDTSQPIAGRLLEINTEYRVRQETARYARAVVSLRAIEAAVLETEGVTYAAAYHNITVDPVDAEGIPLHGINLVAVGGENDDVAAAYYAAAPAGHVLHGTDVSVVIGQDTVGFDRVDTIEVYIEATLTTSTAEDAAPSDLAALANALIVSFGATDLAIGVDVRPYKFAAALASLTGVDSVVVRQSLDGAAWSTAKRSISIREQAVVTTPRVTILEN